MRLAMEMFISPRICRTPSISALTHSMSPSAAASILPSSATGQGCSIRVGPSLPAWPLMRCQISSVMNGMNGCARRRAVSSTRIRVRRVPRWRSMGGVLVPQHRLDQLQVPGAVLVPDELIEGLGGQIEAEGVELAGDFLLGALQLGDDPAVDRGQLDRLAVDPGVLAIGVLDDEVGGVPDLVAEVAEAFDAAHVELDVAAGGGQRAEGEAQASVP
ncbi:Uncharacterised protein [Pseudomonas aeruginosa]|nr:Uncharacterised protein [Pseudomonas aeruginosa]